jgi:Ca2+-binding RTX toxin-like protein
VTNTFSLSISSPTTLANGVYSADNQNNFLDFRGSASGVSVDAGQGLDTIYGSNFNDSIIGGNGNQADAIYGGSGNDTSSGGNGADIFWYTETNSGNDIITDFADGSDLIRFTAASGITAFSQLSPVTYVSGTSGPVKISWAGGSIVFQNITNPALITSADFLGLV